MYLRAAAREIFHFRVQSYNIFLTYANILQKKM